MFDDAPGRMGLPVINNATGEPYARIPASPTPCRWCPKIPTGVPKERKNAVELSARNVDALLHYRECRAVGSFPDDWVVRRNAALIRRVEDEADQAREQRNLISLATILRAGR